MSDNPIETAADELKKWLNVLKELLEKQQAMEAKQAAQQKAAESRALDQTRHDEMMEKLDKLGERLEKAETQEDVDGVKQEAAEIAEENGLEVEGPGVERQDLIGHHRDHVDVSELNEIAGPELEDAFGEGVEGVGKESVGDALGWTKGEKGWKNAEGLSVKELGNSVSDLSKGVGGAGGV